MLRHTSAATAPQKGISLATVRKILGHDRLQTTAIYLNFTDTHIVRLSPEAYRGYGSDSRQMGPYLHDSFAIVPS